MNRRIALAAIAVVTVLCVVGVVITAVAAGGSAMAYSVNGTRVSQKTIDDLLDDVAGMDARGQLSHSEGSVDSQVAAQIVTTNIIHDVMRDAVDRRGVEVSDDDRAAGKETASSQIGSSASVPASYKQLLNETYTYANALGLTDNDALNAFLTRQFRRADITVNPRYGFWNPRFGVCPPTGCQANTGG
jgi:hypothetical protein